METKANYVLIGLFTLLGALGALGLLLWLAKVEADRQYAYYDVLFSDVAGLGTASAVRFNGVPVGQVIELALDDADPSQVRVRIEVGDDTPVTTDTVATLQSQGVTGVSYVALSGGSVEAAPLPENAVIRSERSALQSVFEGAPELLERAIVLLENINAVVNQENRDAAASILDNLDSATGKLDRALDEFEFLSTDLRSAAREVAAFSERLEALGDTAETTLVRASDALASADSAFKDASGTIATIDTFTRDELTPLASELRQTIQNGDSAIRNVDEQVTQLSARLQTLADEGSGALQTLTSQGSDTLRTLTDEGTRTLRTLNEDTRTALQTLTAEGSETIRSLADEGSAALQSATSAFDRANATLELIDQAMRDTSRTLDTADQTFAMTNDLLANDVDQIISDLRAAATAFTETVEAAAGDIDTISDEVLAASQSAARFTKTLDEVVTGNQRQVSQFLRLGLPEFVQFTEEARGLVVNLERLVTRIERDPARFLLGNQNSEFRR